MIQSMTGFGSAERNGCRIEIRSLNHRFLDIYIKAPPFLSQHEIAFRNAVRSRFSRGKFDVNILMDSHVHTDLTVNTESAGKIYAAFTKLKKEFSIPGELDINALTRFSDIFIDISQTYDVAAIHELFNQALDGLNDMRIKEGESLAAEIRVMTDSLSDMNERIKNLCSQVLLEQKEKFRERLRMLLEGTDVDQNRVLQEASFIAAKIDISEEIARMDSHLRQFRGILTDGDTIGRKLDFILQELNREVNTIASKTGDYILASLTVEMKTVIEQMREQVQNIQ